MRMAILFLILCSGCAPFKFQCVPTEVGGYDFIVSGKAPRSSRFEMVDEDKKQKVTFETDNKLNIIPPMNLSAVNLGAAASVK